MIIEKLRHLLSKLPMVQFVPVDPGWHVHANVFIPVLWQVPSCWHGNAKHGLPDNYSVSLNVLVRYTIRM